MADIMKLSKNTDLNNIKPCGVYKVDCESSNLPKSESILYVKRDKEYIKIGEKITP